MNITYPDHKTMLNLHERLAPTRNVFDIVYSHCQIIDEIATQLVRAGDLNLDLDLIHAAAGLHDIGYYSLVDATGRVPHKLIITHGVVGAVTLRKEGMSEAICRIAERHTGLGLTAQHIRDTNLPLPARDLIAETPAEWLILYADKFHTKHITPTDPTDTLGRFNTVAAYRQHAGRFGQRNVRIFDQLVARYGIPNLEALAAKYGQPLH